MRLVHDGVRVYRRARTYILYIRIRGFDVCAEEPCVWPNTDATLTFHRGSHTRWFGANGRKKEREREKNTVCLLILVFVTTQLSAHIGPPPSTPLRIYIYIRTHTDAHIHAHTRCQICVVVAYGYIRAARCSVSINDFFFRCWCAFCCISSLVCFGYC